MKTQKKDYPMVGISGKINTSLSKEVRNELIEVQYRNSAFEKNKALKQALKRSEPKVFKVISTVVYIIGFVSMVGLLIWAISMAGLGY